MAAVVGRLILGLAIAAAAAHAAALPPYPFIHAGGHASMQIAPDIAELEFDLRVFSDDPQQSLELIDGYSAEVTDFLNAAGVAAADIEVLEFKKLLTTEEELADESAPRHSRLMRGLRVCVRDLQNWEQIATGLLQKTYLGNFSVRFGRSDGARINAELTAAAAADAKANAQRLATGFGVRLGAPGAIAPAPLKNIDSAFGLAPAHDPANRPQMRPTTRKLMAPLFVRYTLDLDVIYSLLPEGVKKKVR